MLLARAGRVEVEDGDGHGLTDTEQTEADGGAKTNKAQLKGEMARRDVGEIWADLCSVS